MSKVDEKATKPRKILIHPGIFENEKHLVRLTGFLRSCGYEPIAHKCWDKNPRLIDHDFSLAHSGGYICPVHQESDSHKLSFDPTTVSGFKVATELPIKAVKDILSTDWKFALYKVFFNLRESIRLIYWSRLIRAYVGIRKSGYNFKPKELMIASKNDGFCDLRIIKKAPNYIITKGLHDELLNKPEEFGAIIEEHLIRLTRKTSNPQAPLGR